MCTLNQSLRRHDPKAAFTAFVLDASRDDVAQFEQIELLCPEDLAIDAFPSLAAHLELGELREAVKPYLLRTILERSPSESVLYLDADSYTYGPLQDIEQLAAEHGVLVWARTNAPLPSDGRRPNEADLRGWGLYDPGLLALGSGHDHGALLDWWSARGIEGADAATGAPPVERLTTIARSHFEVQDPALGASFWNLYGRSIEERDGDVLIDGAPLRIARLIDFDPEQPMLLSDKQDRIRVADHPTLERLLSRYADRLLANGESIAREVPYAWDTLPDGTRLDHRLRDIYASAVSDAGLRRSPFTRWGLEEFYAWLAEPAPAGGDFGINRLCWLVREAQPELREAYPDLDRPEQASGYIGWLNAYGTNPGTLPRRLVPSPSRTQEIQERKRTAPGLPWGVNVAGYFESELGVGQAARLVVASLDEVGVSLLPVHGRSAPPSRKGHPFTSLDADAARFPVNLVCVNADGLPGFREEIGEQFFTDRHTIGMWWWEVSSFPERWHDSFSLLDEVWVGSEHVAKALLIDSPVPVYTVTLPVPRPRIESISREGLGLPEGFVFLFMFDYHSVFERKNPLAAIEAFRLAFEPGKGAALVLKCINSADDPANHARLLTAANEHEDVHILDGYMSVAENDALIAACDSYVSLHRSEGFGLTPAEAMALGKPVIATGYSGNLDYMTPRNSYLVDFELMPIGLGNAPYPPDGQWAAPNEEHAARLMREVFEDQAAARERGERAASDVAQTHSLAAAGHSMKLRLESLRARSLGPVHPDSPGQLDSWSPRLDESRGLRSRLTRYLARSQLDVIYARIADLQEQLAESRRETAELRLERNLDAERANRELALLHATVLASLRRQRMG